MSDVKVILIITAKGFPNYYCSEIETVTLDYSAGTKFEEVVEDIVNRLKKGGEK